MLLCCKVVCHPVALSCDIHHMLPYYYLNPYGRKHAHSLGCFAQILMLLHLLLLSKPEDGDGKSRWKPQLSGTVAIASCEIPSSQTEKLMLDVWPSHFQTGFDSPCPLFVVLFYSKNERADYCFRSGKRKRRPLHGCSLEVISDGFQMIIEGEGCQKVESLLQCHTRSLSFPEYFCVTHNAHILDAEL